MTHQDLYRLIQTVQKNVSCPQCGETYSFDHIHIRGIVDSIVFLELACATHMPLLATVTFDKKPTKSKKRKKSTDKIKPDDVLATHVFLKDFAGGFEQMFDKHSS